MEKLELLVGEAIGVSVRARWGCSGEVKNLAAFFLDNSKIFLENSIIFDYFQKIFEKFREFGKLFCCLPNSGMKIRVIGSKV